MLERVLAGPLRPPDCARAGAADQLCGLRHGERCSKWSFCGDPGPSAHEGQEGLQLRRQRHPHQGDRRLRDHRLRNRAVVSVAEAVPRPDSAVQTHGGLQLEEHAVLHQLKHGAQARRLQEMGARGHRGGGEGHLAPGRVSGVQAARNIPIQAGRAGRRDQQVAPEEFRRGHGQEDQLHRPPGQEGREARLGVVFGAEADGHQELHVRSAQAAAAQVPFCFELRAFLSVFHSHTTPCPPAR